MKKICRVIFALLLVTALTTSVNAIDESQKYRYELSVDGQDTKEVKTGDVITVVLNLLRTDSQDAYIMYAMQNEIQYDSEFFELVEGSEILTSGIQSNDIATRENTREFYMNYLSFNGGDTWNAKTLIGSFQLRVIGTSGVTKITSSDYLVATSDGSDSYYCESNDLTIILSTDCSVRFESNGGTPIDGITAVYGETIVKPKNPQKDGKYFAGWYRDIDCINAWDFEDDVLSGNMTLYAKWSDTPIEDDIESAEGFGLWWLAVAVPAVVAVVIVILLVRITGNKRIRRRRGRR